MFIKNARSILGCVVVILMIQGTAPLAGQEPQKAMLSPQDRILIDRYLARKNSGVADSGLPRGFFKSSGDPSIEKMIQMDFFVLTGRFGVNPNQYYYDDGEDRNALWIPRTIGSESPLARVVPNSFATVLIGRNYLAEEIRRTPRGAPRNFSLMATLSHELAHMVQFANKSRLSTTQRELEADFLAGWSIHCEKRGGHPEIDEEVVFRQFYDMGDESLVARLYCTLPLRSCIPRRWRNRPLALRIAPAGPRHGRPLSLLLPEFPMPRAWQAGGRKSHRDRPIRRTQGATHAPMPGL